MVVAPAALSACGRFPEEMDRDWVGRACHVSADDRELAWCRADQVARLGDGVQLVTVRAIGTFLPDPAAVPAPVAAAGTRATRELQGLCCCAPHDS